MIKTVAPLAVFIIVVVVIALRAAALRTIEKFIEKSWLGKKVTEVAWN